LAPPRSWSRPVQQVAALPYRTAADGSAEVLLITSRDTQRWVVPKGNPMRGYSAHEAAAVEAFEEAGVRGIPCPTALGVFMYWKTRRARQSKQVATTLYPLSVVEQVEDWPEREQRTTRWFSLPDAAAAVDEPELKRLIAGFQAPPAPSGLASRVLPALQTRVRRRLPVL
jgi:8-oxo-dGTP pyrophosphatase MutT (NUDIX family)